MKLQLYNLVEVNVKGEIKIGLSSCKKLIEMRIGDFGCFVDMKEI